MFPHSRVGGGRSRLPRSSRCSSRSLRAALRRFVFRFPQLWRTPPAVRAVALRSSCGTAAVFARRERGGDNGSGGAGFPLLTRTNGRALPSACCGHRGFLAVGVDSFLLLRAVLRYRKEGGRKHGRARARSRACKAGQQGAPRRREPPSGDGGARHEAPELPELPSVPCGRSCASPPAGAVNAGGG